MYEGRSALDQLREAAWAPMFYKSFLGSEGFGAGMGGNHDEVRKKAGEPMSFDDGREQALRETGELCSLIAAFPDEKLDEEVTLPVGGGMVLTMAEVLGVHYWNLVYHQGQVNYIQTLLGDREMH